MKNKQTTSDIVLLKWEGCKRLNFYLVDVFGKQFLCLSSPFKKGDGANGKLRRLIKLVPKIRDLQSGILRSEHGFQGMKINIKIEFLKERGA